MFDGFIIILGLKEERSEIILVHFVVWIGLDSILVFLQCTIQLAGNRISIEKLSLHVGVTRVACVGCFEEAYGIVGSIVSHIQIAQERVRIGLCIAVFKSLLEWFDSEFVFARIHIGEGLIHIRTSRIRGNHRRRLEVQNRIIECGRIILPAIERLRATLEFIVIGQCDRVLERCGNGGIKLCGLVKGLHGLRHQCHVLLRIVCGHRFLLQYLSL